jgi:hypothetical protein
MQNKALQQNRDEVLRYGESIGCDLLKAAVLPREAQSQSQSQSNVAFKSSYREWCLRSATDVRQPAFAEMLVQAVLLCWKLTDAKA